MSDADSSDAARARALAALASLPRVERFACGALIARQIGYPRVLRRIEQDGAEAAVKFCSGQAMRAYMLPFFLAMVVAAAADHGGGPGLAVFGTLTVATGVLATLRKASATRAAKAWRGL